MFSLSIPSSYSFCIVLFAQHTCVEHQKIAGCSAAGGYWKFCVSRYWFFCGWGAEGLWLWVLSISGGPFLVGFAYHHHSPLCHALPHSYKWGNAVPMSISLLPAWASPWHGDCCNFRDGSSVLIVGVGVAAGVGGIGQSFLVSNRFSDVDPELGQGVLCLGGALGISSSGGGLDPSFWGSGCWMWDLSKLSHC